jgi:hypothetical protein
MKIAGLILSFIGTILMLPEGFRLSRKNQEGFICFETELPFAHLCPKLFSLGVCFLSMGFLLQFIGEITSQ